MTSKAIVERINLPDLIMGIALIGLGAFCWFWLIPNGVRVPSRLTNFALSPAFWPQIIAVIIMLSGSWLALESLFASLQSRSPQTSEEDDNGGIESGGLRRLIIALALLPCYFFAADQYGLLLPSIVAFMAYSLLAGERRVVVLLTLGVAVPGVITLIFIKAANILVPLGPLSGFF